MDSTNTLLNLSVEQTPKKVIKSGVSECILTHADYISITHLPGTKLKDTTKAVRTLVDRDGVAPERIIPHIGARNLKTKAELTRQSKELASIGVTSALLIGGSSPDNVNTPFHQDDDLVRPVTKAGINRLYYGVYPHSFSPGYYEHFKNTDDYSGGISQLCLSPRRLRKYADIRIGTPSYSDFGGLYRYMKICGVGPSLKYPLRDLPGILHYMTYNGFATTRFVRDLRKTHNKFHLYDFGQIEQTLIDLIDQES